MKNILTSRKYVATAITAIAIMSASLHAGSKSEIQELKNTIKQLSNRLEQLEKKGSSGGNKSLLTSENVKLSGWARVDYGIGDRYSDSQGDDSFGVSKYAIVAEAKHENFSFVGVAGGSALSQGGSEDFAIRDAFIVWDEINGSDLKMSVGAQPLLFGLHPNGYPGDRSLQASVEYGGAGGFAVSNQAGPSLILSHPVEGVGSIRGGIFDTSETSSSTLGKEDGSSITKNGFVQVNAEDIAGVDGLYGIAGLEYRYEGDTDSSEPIYDVGIGYKTDLFDASFEYIALDKGITGTTSDETYYVAELAVMPWEKTKLTLDYSHADKLDVDTLRAEIGYQINEHVDYRIGYSKDMLSSSSDVDSIDMRLSFGYY